MTVPRNSPAMKEDDMVSLGKFKSKGGKPFQQLSVWKKTVNNNWTTMYKMQSKD